ncbi:MAG: histidine--tRNA ligase [Patescibacteria group bacterium]|nr:histidine--tRNA ligase [Patescibacteria group bacterium]
MAAEQGPMSGFRDMLAEEMIARNGMIGTIQGVYESYGFVPLKTPALERLSTLTGKYGDEGESLMYKFKDNGGRDVAMRYDQTVPLARVVAQYGSRLPMPYKRYAVGEVWRGESPQAGRYREFTQFDADIVGTTSSIADAEVIGMMSDTMTALGAESVIRVNNRSLLDALAEKAGYTERADAMKIISTIDKVDKIGKNAVVAEISEGFGETTGQLVSDYLSVDGAPLDKLAKIRELLGGSDSTTIGADNLTEIFSMLQSSGYTEDQVVFDQSIARGLSYYTGVIYETTLKGAEELGSVCSGGRFDNLVESLGGPSLPAVGTSIGVDRLLEGLKKLGRVKEFKTTTEVLVTNFDSNDAPNYVRVARELRQAGIASEVYYEDVKLKKQLSFANRMNIPYVVLIGPDEAEKGVAVLKTLASGQQLEIAIDELPTYIAQLKANALKTNLTD